MLAISKPTLSFHSHNLSPSTKNKAPRQLISKPSSLCFLKISDFQTKKKPSRGVPLQAPPRRLNQRPLTCTNVRHMYTYLDFPPSKFDALNQKQSPRDSPYVNLAYFATSKFQNFKQKKNPRGGCRYRHLLGGSIYDLLLAPMLAISTPTLTLHYLNFRPSTKNKDHKAANM